VVQITLTHSMSAFNFVVYNPNRFEGEKGIILRAVGEKTELLYYNARSKSLIKIRHKMQVYFLCR
jgi:hypothetical protein